MIEPYQAIGLVPTMRGIRHRDEIGVNIEHIRHLIKAASWLSSLDLPVRLIAIPEGALQGFNDEVLDLDHETFARESAVDVPGPETDALGGNITAREILAEARDLLGGNGILQENHVMRHMVDIEAIHTFEGTETMQTLIVGRDITGFGAFA